MPYHRRSEHETPLRRGFLGILRFLALGEFIRKLTQRFRGQPEKPPAPAATGLEREIQQIEAALAVTPRHRPYRASLLRDLSNRLRQQYTKSGTSRCPTRPRYTTPTGPPFSTS